ncbi:MAG: primosomal protein N', partial [Bauldia litoralis]
MLLPLPLKGAYDYSVPAGLSLAPGDFVRVPFGQREATGVVWGPGSGEVGDNRLKPVAARFDAPPLPEAHRRFVDWVARYTLTAPGSVLRMSMSIPEALEPPPPDIVLRRAGDPPTLRITAARQKALDALGEAELAGPDLQRDAGVGAGVVKGLVDAGARIKVERPA